MQTSFHRIKRLPPYVFAEVNAMKAKARAAGADIIDLGMGNPDQPTPKHIVDKLVEAAANPRNHRYSVSRGIPGLRKAYAAYYERRFNVSLDAETEVIVTLGSKEGLANLAQAHDHRIDKQRGHPPQAIGDDRENYDHHEKLNKLVHGFSLASVEGLITDAQSRSYRDVGVDSSQAIRRGRVHVLRQHRLKHPASGRHRKPESRRYVAPPNAHSTSATDYKLNPSRCDVRTAQRNGGSGSYEVRQV